MKLYFILVGIVVNYELFDAETEALDELNDAEILRDVITSVTAWKLNKLLKQRKR